MILAGPKTKHEAAPRSEGDVCDGGTKENI